VIYLARMFFMDELSSLANTKLKARLDRLGQVMTFRFVFERRIRELQLTLFSSNLANARYGREPGHRSL